MRGHWSAESLSWEMAGSLLTWYKECGTFKQRNMAADAKKVSAVCVQEIEKRRRCLDWMLQGY